MRWLRTGAGVLLVTSAVWFHEQLTARRSEFPPELDVLYVPPPEHLQWMSLGYREALADVIWVRALIFTGRTLGEDDVASIQRYVEAITGLSPRFHRAYVWGGIAPIYSGSGAITRAMVDRAVEIYRRGLEQFPESHELLYPLGMLLTHQVSSTAGYTASERDAMNREGVELIRRAAAFGADPLVRQYAATLITEYATDQLALRFLESQFAQAENPEHRRMLRRKIERLAGNENVESIERIRAEFVEAMQKQAPYLPDIVYAVIRTDPASQP